MISIELPLSAQQLTDLNAGRVVRVDATRLLNNVRKSGLRISRVSLTDPSSGYALLLLSEGKNSCIVTGDERLSKSFNGIFFIRMYGDAVYGSNTKFMLFVQNDDEVDPQRRPGYVFVVNKADMSPIDLGGGKYAMNFLLRLTTKDLLNLYAFEKFWLFNATYPTVSVFVDLVKVEETGEVLEDRLNRATENISSGVFPFKKVDYLTILNSERVTSKRFTVRVEFTYPTGDTVPPVSTYLNTLTFSGGVFTGSIAD